MSAHEHLNPEQFGITARESTDIQAKAIAGHLFAVGESLFGNMKVNRQSQAYDTLRAQFPGHDIKIDPADDPYVEARQGKWSLRHFNAPYAEIHHAKHGPQDAIHWGHGDEHLSVRPEHLGQELSNWVTNYSADYEGHM